MTPKTDAPARTTVGSVRCSKRERRGTALAMTPDGAGEVSGQDDKAHGGGVEHGVVLPVVVARTRDAGHGEKAVLDGLGDFVVPQVEHDTAPRGLEPDVGSVAFEPGVADVLGRLRRLELVMLEGSSAAEPTAAAVV